MPFCRRSYTPAAKSDPGTYELKPQKFIWERTLSRKEGKNASVTVKAPEEASSHAKNPAGKHPDEWTTELWENFRQDRKILKKKSLLLSGGYVIIIERDCTKICDEAGGCRRRRVISAEYVRFQTGRQEYR